MPVYKVEGDGIVPLTRTTFARQGVRERQDIQTLLKANIGIISPETLVVAEEFGEWEDSRRRIDLLGIDKSANLVVIELKRTEDGGHMELQAIRYAAMISTLTFEKLVAIYARYLATHGSEADAVENLLKFLDWSEPDEESFGKEVRIVLASAEFSKELTTSVMWLRDYGLDIRCVRMHPYASGEQIFLDVQTVIPLPEVADYQVQFREKRQSEREARAGARDLTRFDVRAAGQRYSNLSKRGVMFRLISEALRQGASPQQVMDAIPWRSRQLFQAFEGTLSAAEVQQRLGNDDAGGAIPKSKRFFCNEDEIFHEANRTYVLSNQWGARTLEAANALKAAFPKLNIEVSPSSE